MISGIDSSLILNASNVNYQTNPFALLNSDNIFEDCMNARMNQLINGTSSFQSSDFKHYNVRTDLPSVKDSYNSGVSEKLARTAERNALIRNTKGWCAKGVNDSLQAANITNGETRVSEAHMSADVLANHPNFKEVYIKREDIQNLPAGCVICWNRSAYGNSLSGRYGHIAVTLGNGKEASDNVSNLKIFNSEYRVFVPVSTNGVNA